MFYPRAWQNPQRRDRVPNHTYPNWLNGCHDRLPGYAELLKQYSRWIEPYQSGLATERGGLWLAGDRGRGKLVSRWLWVKLGMEIEATRP
jgi:hypothetical protein